MFNDGQSGPEKTTWLHLLKPAICAWRRSSGSVPPLPRPRLPQLFPFVNPRGGRGSKLVPHPSRLSFRPASQYFERADVIAFAESLAVGSPSKMAPAGERFPARRPLAKIDAMSVATHLSADHDADKFLRMLGASHTFQTFDDSRKSNHRLSRIMHGTFAQHAAALEQLNIQGAGVFVMVNAGDGRGRRASNVQAVRALFADLDGAPLSPVKAFPLRPHIIVESSPGRWHAYWFAKDVPLDDFKQMQQSIALRFEATRRYAIYRV